MPTLRSTASNLWKLDWVSIDFGIMYNMAGYEVYNGGQKALGGSFKTPKTTVQASEFTWDECLGNVFGTYNFDSIHYSLDDYPYDGIEDSTADLVWKLQVGFESTYSNNQPVVRESDLFDFTIKCVVTDGGSPKGDHTYLCYNSNKGSYRVTDGSLQSGGSRLFGMFNDNDNGNIFQGVGQADSSHMCIAADYQAQVFHWNTSTTTYWKFSRDLSSTPNVYPPARPIFQGWPTSCFTGKTIIAMADGSFKKISDVRIGDRVRVYDTKNGEIIDSRVSKVFVHPDTKEYITINDVLEVTCNHEIYNGTEWVKAGELRLSDKILDINNNHVEVVSIDFNNNQAVTTYNFEVESEHHNYYADGFLVHNKSLVFNPQVPVTPPPPIITTTINMPPPGPITPVNTCFTGDTEILLPDEEVKHISDIEVDDIVLTYDVDTGENNKGKVVKTMVHTDAKEIIIFNNNIKVTPEHPLYDGKGWKRADEFKLHDKLHGFHHDVVIASIRKEECTVPVYNFEIEAESHNYYANEILAHNSKTVTPPFTNPTGPWCGTVNVPAPISPTTSAPIISCINCGGITSKPYIVGTANGSGIPDLIKSCNTNAPANTGITSPGIRAFFEAPVQVYGWNKGKIGTYLSIDKDGKMVGLSDHRTSFAGSNGSDIHRSVNILGQGSGTQTHVQPAPADSFVTYDLYVHYINSITFVDGAQQRTDTTGVPANVVAGKEYIGTISYNPANTNVQSASLRTDITWANIGRSLTAVNTDTGDESRLYVPTNGINILQPLVLSNDTSYVGWVNQGSGYTPDVTNICYEVEWQKPSPTTNLDPTSGYTHYMMGKHKCTGYIPVSSTVMQTDSGQAIYGGMRPMAMTNCLTRPRKRHPVCTSSFTLDHRDHQPRRFDLFNSKFDDDDWRRVGHVFTQSTSLSGKAFSFTPRAYIESTSSTVTAARLAHEHRESGWTITEFTDLTGLSAYEYGKFLHVFNKLSITSPLTSSQSYLEILGFCTLHGSLTAADGSFYCAAIARTNPPSWCEIGAEIGGSANSSWTNFVVCASGKNLILPYLTYKLKT